MIENKFLYFKTYQDFQNKLNSGAINENSIAFIEDESIIWTHGNEFVCNSEAIISQDLGDNPNKTISQKTLTSIVNMIWSKIEEITGENSYGINMTVIPEHYLGDGGFNLNISARSLDPNGIFQKIKFYVDDRIVGEYENVSVVDIRQVFVSGPCTVKCEATINGRLYVASKHISNTSFFWMGSGNSYNEIMTDGNVVDISHGLRITKDVTFDYGDNLFIVMNNDVVSSFIQADMNGVEIPLNGPIDVPGESYVYFVSKNTFRAGTYNIDINK